MPGNRTNKFDDVCQMIFVPGVVFTTVRLKQVVPRGQLEGHARGGPDVGRWAVACA